MDINGIMFIPNFVKIGRMAQNLKFMTHRQAGSTTHYGEPFYDLTLLTEENQAKSKRCCHKV